jgi:regulator of sigma E protease
MDLLTSILAFLVALGLLIVVHELGHFWVARWCGVKVLRFSVGFGRPIARWVRGPDRTEWVIAAVPYGGYVRMLDERETDSGPIDPADLPRAFNRQPVARRAAIVAAGPAANLLLAVFIYFALNLIGTPDLRPVLSQPAAGTLAAQAGFGEGDLVLRIDDRQIRSWGDLRWALLQRASDRARPQFVVRGSDGAERTLRLDLSSVDTDRSDVDWFGRIGLEPGGGVAIVRATAHGGAAEQAGVQAGDWIVAIDGTAVRSGADVSRLVGARPHQTLQLQIERGGKPMTIQITPTDTVTADGKHVGRIGIEVGTHFRDTIVVRDGPFGALQRAAARTWETSTFSLRMLGKMVVGRASWKNLSGPVTIADVAGQSARIGPLAYLNFLALVSISLGVLNLLPVPVLDGGHLLYYAIEVVTGSPPSPKWLELGQRVGIGLLVVLTALALYNDLTRLLFQ